MDWFNERQDLKVRDAIRNQLKGQYFGKIEIWRLFGANVTLAVWKNYKNSKGRLSFITDLVFLIYLSLFRDFFKWRSRKRTYLNSCAKKSIVIEALSDEKRIRNLWLPVTEQFEKFEVILVTPNEDIYLKYKDKFNVYVIDQFSIYDWLSSRVEILKFTFRNLKFIFLKRIKFPLSGLDLLNIYIIQLDYVIRFKYMIQKFQPSSFVTTWDWYNLGSAGTLVFNANDLPTFTYIHGAGGKEALREFVPLNADYIFSWGKINTKALIDLGVKPDAILEVGCPRMKPFKPQAILQKDVSLVRMLIILSANIDSHFVKDIVKIADSYSSMYDIVIRLHPSTSLDTLHPEIKKLNVLFVTTRDESIEETIHKADLIITDTTSAAFDVVFLDKPLFVIDSAPNPRPQDIVNDIVSYKAAVFSRSFDDLYQKIHQYVLKPNIEIELSVGRKNFVEDFLHAAANESSVNTRNKIRSILSS